MILSFLSFFFGTKTFIIDSQRSFISHGSELDGKIQVNTNYCVATRIPSSREVVIRIPTNVTIISTFHSLFWREIIVIDSQRSIISHGSELDGKIQVNTNYCVVTRIPSSREVVIRIPTNVTIISTFHSLFWREIIVIDSQRSIISHGSELDGKIQVITNYCVVTRIPSSREVVIRIPTNVTIISTLHSFFLARNHCHRLTMLIHFSNTSLSIIQ